MGKYEGNALEEIMKDISVKIDLDNLPEESENHTSYDINISEFNSTNAYLELEEDITEKVISYIEKEVRSSYEYKKYINYLKTELDLTKCSLLPGIDSKESAVSLEFHHYPLNLYEIVETISKQRVTILSEGEKVSCFEISEQVMEEHFRGNIGLVPLTKTMHEMAHNRSIIVPIDKVQGNYKKFIKKYSSYIDEDIKLRISECETTSIDEDSKIFNQAKLEKNITKFNVKYLPREAQDED